VAISLSAATILSRLSHGKPEDSCLSIFLFAYMGNKIPMSLTHKTNCGWLGDCFSVKANFN